MKFEAERRETYIVKSLFNDAQRRRLLRDEQHSLSSQNIVRDYIAYSLRFARSRRSVQNETFR